MLWCHGKAAQTVRGNRSWQQTWALALRLLIEQMGQFGG